eukprot:3063926-Amphidinium_carterae.1
MSGSLWNLAKRQANDIIYQCVLAYKDEYQAEQGNEHLRTIGHYLDYRCDKLVRAINGERKHAKSAGRAFESDAPPKEKLKKETFMRQVWRIKRGITGLVTKLKAEGIMTNDGIVHVEQEDKEGSLEAREIHLGMEVNVVNDTRRLLSSCAAAGLPLKHQEVRAGFAGLTGLVTDLDKYDGTVCLTFKEPHADVWFGRGALCPKPAPVWAPPTEEALQAQLAEQEKDENRERRAEEVKRLQEQYQELKGEVKEIGTVPTPL